MPYELGFFKLLPLFTFIIELARTDVQYEPSPSLSIGEKIPDGRIISVGDYNGDGRPDFFFAVYTTVEVYSLTPIDSFYSSLSTLFFGPKQNTRESKLQLLLTIDVSCTIEGAHAVDWNFDGRLDLLVVCSTVQSDWFDNYSLKATSTHTNYYVIGFVQNYGTGSIEKVWQSNLQDSVTDNHEISFSLSDIYPFIVDINFDGLPDLIGQWDNVRFVWINTGTNSFSHTHWTGIPNIRGSFSGYIVHPHSSGFVDVNGDCKADIVLVVSVNGTLLVEVWLSVFENGTGGYQMKDEIVLPSGSGQLVFDDFNRDGTIDIVVPACDKNLFSQNYCSGNDGVFMAANIQDPVCGAAGYEGKCRPYSDLCTASEFRLSFTEMGMFSFSLLDESNVIHFSGNNYLPVTLRSGDFDGDGYPDLLMIVRNAEGRSALRLYKNDMHQEVGFLRVFRFYSEVLMSDGFDSTTYASFFYDFFEEGVLDVIAFGVLNEKRKFVSVTFIHSADSDTLFLKVTALNGIPTKTKKFDSKFANSHPYGVNTHGPTFKLIVTDIRGNWHVRAAGQLSQSAHTPLSLTTAFFGLGYTSSYVQSLTLGMPIEEEEWSNTWTSIIPNSQIFSIPYPRLYPKQWTIELSVSPSKKLLSVLLATLFTLIFVGAVIFMLHRREKEEDLVEHRGFRSNFIIN